MKTRFSRRQFLKTGTAAPFLICSARTAFTYTPNEQIRFALIGSIATRERETLSYDFRTGRFTNNDTANAMLKRGPRKGWKFGYL